MSNPAMQFDTLVYAKRLIAVGFSTEQAEVQAEVMADAITGTLVTKHDLDLTELALRQEIADLRTELKHDIRELEQKFDYRFNLLESRLTIRLGGMMIVGIGLSTAIMTLLLKF